MVMKRQLKLGLIASALVAVMAISLACGAEPTPVPAPQPNAAPAPTATAVPAATQPTAVPAPTTVTDARVEFRRGGTLKHAQLMGSGATLDGHTNLAYEYLRVLYTVYDTIVNLEPDGTIGPGLAQSWKFSSDGKVVTFNLHKGVKFHDGSAFNADIVKWNIERQLDPDVGALRRRDFEATLASLKVVDDETIIFNLQKPFRPFLALLTERAGYILSPAAVESLGQDFGARPVGTGPFKMVDWKVGDSITVERFEGYREPGKPYLDKILFQNIPDRTLQLAMVRTGETDVIKDVTAQDIPIIERNPSLKIDSVTGGQVWGFFMNTSKEPFDNRDLRQAIALATDRETFRDVWYEGRARVAYVPSAQGWEYNPDIQPLKYDLNKAKQKLTQAGYPSGARLTIFSPSSTYDMQMTEFYQAMLEEANIHVDITAVSFGEWWGSLWPKFKGQRSIFGRTWVNPRADPHQNLNRLYTCGASSNWMGYCNSEVDMLVAEAAKIYDVAKAKPLYDRINTIIAEDVPWVYVAYPEVYAVMQDYVQGWKWRPDLFARFGELWIQK